MITVNAQALVKMLDLYRVSSDVREFVRGVAIEPHGKKPGAALVRTDGHSIAVWHDDSAELNHSVLLLKNAKLMPHLRRWAKKPDNRVVILPAEGKVGLLDPHGKDRTPVDKIFVPDLLLASNKLLLGWRSLFAPAITSTAIKNDFAYEAGFVTRARALVGATAANTVQTNAHGQQILIIGAKESPALAMLMPAQAEITHTRSGYMLGPDIPVAKKQDVAAIQENIKAICAL